MRRSENYPQGAVHRLTVDSLALGGNALGDPSVRELAVYTPAGWQAGAALPLLVGLAGFGSTGQDHVARKNIGENVPERLDRLIGQGAMRPAVVAFPDCMTAFGGNQYINSAGTGRYADYLIDEIVPLVEQRFGCGGTGRRGLFGKSSGGFGALWHGMNRADFWAAVSCNSGDMGFDIVYKIDLYAALDVLARFGHSIEGFLRHFENADKVTPQERGCRMLLAMAATYDPDPDPGVFRGIRLPCDVRSGRFIEARWANWLRYDPVLVAQRHAASLRGLKGLWIDCGARDQFFLHLGARQLVEELTRLEVAHVYEEFDDEHLDVDYRMDRFLPFLASALT